MEIQIYKGDLGKYFVNLHWIKKKGHILCQLIIFQTRLIFWDGNHYFSNKNSSISIFNSSGTPSCSVVLCRINI